MEKSDFKILVVDDEEDWVITNKKVLTRNGFSAHGASCAEDALEKAGKTPYHMAFLDINMPGMEGIELISHLRERSPDIKVVMLTGYGTEDKSANARQEGILDFLEKMGPAGDRVLGDEMIELAEEVFSQINE